MGHETPYLKIGMQLSRSREGDQGDRLNSTDHHSLLVIFVDPKKNGVGVRYRWIGHSLTSSGS